MSRPWIPGLVIVLALTGATGCAGARMNIVAPTAEVPVSLSRGVRDAEGSLVPAERRKIVGHIEVKRKAWALVWSLVSLTPERDISDAVNEQVKRVNGDAVINLRIGAAQCSSNFAVFLDALPIWPGCANVTITGDIIQVAGAAPAAPPPVPPPPQPAAANDVHAGGDPR